MSKKDDQPAEGGNPLKEFFSGLSAAMNDSARAIARESAQTVHIMFEEYQRAGFSRTEAFELIRMSMANDNHHHHSSEPLHD